METIKKPLLGKPLAWLLSLIYFSSYVTRINFAAVMQEIITDTGYAKSQLSVILVALSITYGVGQIVNGIIGDHVKPQNLILCGLVSATVINILFPFCVGSVALMTVMWALNGFAQAMMWPPIVKILVNTANEEEYGYAVVRVSWGSSFGTVLMYLTAPLIIGLVGWQGVFVASAIIGTSATVIWAILSRRIPVEKQASLPSGGEKKQKMHFPRRAVLPIVLIVSGIIFQGMLRDGVTNWMPTYLAEVFDFGNQTSIFITVSLAVFSILTFGVADKLYRKFFQNEVMCGGVIFAVAVLSAVVMAIFFNAGAWLAVLMMAMITGCMHGVNLMLITHVPKRFKKYGNISTISGALNACTYVGAAIATYGVAKLSEIVGWRNTVAVWAIIGLLGTLCCFVAVRMWKKFIEE